MFLMNYETSKLLTCEYLDHHLSLFLRLRVTQKELCNCRSFILLLVSVFGRTDGSFFTCLMDCCCRRACLPCNGFTNGWNERQVYQNYFLNAYTFNIQKKLRIISFFKESFNYDTNAEYRCALQTKIHLELTIKTSDEASAEESPEQAVDYFSIYKLLSTLK